MKKVWLVIWLALVLAACGPSTPPDAGGGTVLEEGLEPATADGEAEQVAETSAAPQEDVRQAEAEEIDPGVGAAESGEETDGAAQSDEAVALNAEGDPVDVVFPATTPAEASVVRETDHVLGAADPLVQIIGYGDFQ